MKQDNYYPDMTIAPGRMPERMMPEQMMPGKMPERMMPEQMMPGKMPERMMPERMAPSKMPERMMPEQMMPGKMPGKMPEQMMPGKMPGKMSERMMPDMMPDKACVPWEQVIKDVKLAHAYVPIQKMCTTFMPMKSLIEGTAFPELINGYGWEKQGMRGDY